MVISEDSKYKILVSDVSDQEISDKTDPSFIQDALVDINLSQYGTGIEHIYFSFATVKPSNDLHENNVEYDTESKMLTIELNLSYEHVLSSSRKEIEGMMVQLFLVSISLYEEAGIENFDIVTFKNDCEEKLMPSE